MHIIQKYMSASQFKYIDNIQAIRHINVIHAIYPAQFAERLTP